MFGPHTHRGDTVVGAAQGESYVGVTFDVEAEVVAVCDYGKHFSCDFEHCEVRSERVFVGCFGLVETELVQLLSVHRYKTIVSWLPNLVQRLAEIAFYHTISASRTGGLPLI